MESVIGLQKVMIRDINPNIFNGLIIGIIIAKNKAKVYSQTNSESRAVWSFTIRDTVQDYINVTSWSSGDIITFISDIFTIGDIVEIHKPKIEVRKINDYGEQFRPRVTSPYTLTINDPKLQLTKHQGECEKLKKLLFYTTKPITGYVTLANILNADILNVFVDILVAVRSVQPPRSIIARNENVQVREIVVFDNTNAAFKISLWDPVYIQRSNNWMPKQTILFMTDMKIDFNKFLKTKTASVTSRTVITEDPLGSEADTLRNYAMTADLAPLDVTSFLTATIPHLDSIQTVMTVAQITNKLADKQTSDLKKPEDYQFACIIYGMITKFDLDGVPQFIIKKCTNCRSIITEDKCTKRECFAAMGVQTGNFDLSFDIKLTISDHTGSLKSCRLNGATAETTLGYDAYTFMSMSDFEKNNLKWKFLLERFEFKLAILYIPDRNPVITIANVAQPTPTEVANKLPHF